MARSRWCTILNGSSRESATMASPIRGATHSGSSSRASRKLASASSSRPRFRSARPTASMTSGFSGAASRACSKRAERLLYEALARQGLALLQELVVVHRPH